MGEVHLAKDTRLDRKVAIKLLHAGSADRGVSQERFKSEARAVSRLNHPHICALYDGENRTAATLVMELLDGETLARRLAHGPLPPDQVLRHSIEIAEALDHAHRHGLVHRDLKPANVMLTRAGAKLLDFGIAKWHAEHLPGSRESAATVTQEHPLTGDGQVVGTVQYMAPEQLDGRAVDARTRSLFSARSCTRWPPGGRLSTPTVRHRSSPPSWPSSHPPSRHCSRFLRRASTVLSRSASQKIRMNGGRPHAISRTH